MYTKKKVIRRFKKTDSPLFRNLMVTILRRERELSMQIRKRSLEE